MASNGRLAFRGRTQRRLGLTPAAGYAVSVRYYQDGSPRLHTVLAALSVLQIFGCYSMDCAEDGIRLTVVVSEQFITRLRAGAMGWLYGQDTCRG